MNEVLANTSEPVTPEYREEEHDELIAEHFKRHPDQLAKPKDLRDFGPEVEKLENLMAEFETKYSLAELNAITDLSDDLLQIFDNAEELENPGKVEAFIKCLELNNPAYIETYKAKIAAARAIVLTPEDARKFEIRRLAMKDERVIAGLFDKIKKEANIPIDKLEELQVKGQILFKAVGFFRKNNRRIEHER